MKSFLSQFPRSEGYRRLLMPACTIVREDPQPGYGFRHTERHLQCTWYDARLRPDILHTSEGEDVVVQHPGRWNLEAGPDFLDAVLLVGQHRRRVVGDVEVHVRPADWVSHGHSGDPRYSGVIAHVCYSGAPAPADAMPTGVIEIALYEDLRRNPYFSFESIDVGAYPYAEHGPRTPCAEILAVGRVDNALELLDAAGEQRLQQKAERMMAAIAERGETQVLYEEIMCALGYKNNRAAFRQLARRLPVARLTAECEGRDEDAYALLLGVAGLLPADVGKYDDGTRTFVRGLWDCWWKKQGEWEPFQMTPESWSLGSQRPQNHPVRRLAAAAALFSRSPSMYDQVLAANGVDPQQWLQAMRKALCATNTFDHWKRRLTFASSPGDRDVAIIGKERATAIISNAILPFCAATGYAADQLAGIMGLLPPEQSNSQIRHTAALLLGPDHNPKLYRNALRQQGLLQIFNDFCLNDRSGCISCALPAALEEAFATAKPVE